MRIESFYSVDEGVMVSEATATEYVVIYESAKNLNSPENLSRSWMIIYL